MRAYARGDREFRLAEGGGLEDDSGHRWKVTEAELVPPSGLDLATAPRVPGHVAYWFGWFAFYPNTEVYSGE